MGFPVNNFTMMKALAKGIRGDSDFEFMEDSFFEVLDRELSKFNLFAFIIHDPVQHKEFNDYLRKNFLSIHRYTGKKFLFFALAQPPDNWLKEVEGSGFSDFYNLWPWKTGEKYREITSIKVVSDTLANLFKIDITDSPGVIIFKNFREKEFLYVGTDQEMLENQFYLLTGHSSHAGDLNLYELYKRLGSSPFVGKGIFLKYNNSPIIELLDTVVTEITHRTGSISPDKTETHLTELENLFMEELHTVLASIRRELKEDDLLDEDHLEHVYEILSKLSSILITRSSQRMDQPKSRLLDYLSTYFEDDSLRSLRTSLLIKKVLDYNQRQQSNKDGYDYATVGIGFARAFENEINLSFAHFVRKKLEINLPPYFCKHEAGVPAVMMVSGKYGPFELNFNYKKDKNIINGLDWSPLEIGKNLKAFEEININKAKYADMYEELLTRFGSEKLDVLLKNWRLIRNIRNDCAHPNTVTRQNIDMLEEAYISLMENGIFEVLAELKYSYKGENQSKSKDETKMPIREADNGLSTMFRQVEGLISVIAQAGDKNAEFLSDLLKDTLREVSHGYARESSKLHDFLEVYRALGSPDKISNMAVPFFYYVVENNLGYNSIRLLRMMDGELRNRKELVPKYIEVMWDKTKNHTLREYCMGRLNWWHRETFFNIAKNDLEKFIKENENDKEIIVELMEEISLFHEEIKDKQAVFPVIKKFIKQNKVKTYGFSDEFLKIIKSRKY